MFAKNSIEFGLATSHGGLPITASKPERSALNTSGNSSSQWKKRFCARTQSHVSSVFGGGNARVVGRGASAILRMGQNQQAHHRSIARSRAWYCADPPISSR